MGGIRGGGLAAAVDVGVVTVWLAATRCFFVVGLIEYLLETAHVELIGDTASWAGPERASLDGNQAAESCQAMRPRENVA